MGRSAFDGLLGAALAAATTFVCACGGADEAAAVFDDAGAADAAAAGPALGSPCSKAGELGCQGVGQKLQLLCDGTKWTSNGVCAGDLVCDPRPGPTLGSCQTPPPACTSMGLLCEGSAIVRCGADRLSVERTECASPEHCKQAVGGICAKCLAWEVKCEGAELKKCAPDRQGMVLKETCASAALCNPTSGTCKEPACTAGTYRCNGDVLEKCAADTSAFEGVATCSAGLCDATSMKCRECTVGGKDCVGAIPRACDASGTWTSLAACGGTTPICKEGVCAATACAAGDHRCSGDTLEQCNSTLTGFDPVKVCPAGMCDATGKECNECAPGASDCLGSTPRACDSTGHWKALTTCSGTTPVCKSGVCTAVCSSGEYRCSASSSLERCNASLSGFEIVNLCAAGLCDAVGKECDECTPGEKGCAGTVPRTCNSTGHWTSMTACAGSTPYCSAGACVASTLVTYSQSFSYGVASGPGTAQCTAWTSFRSSLTGTYTKLTLTGSRDTTGVTCTGAPANTICRALGSGTTTNISCDGRTWRVAECTGGGGTNWELSAGSSGTCGCFWGWAARPCMGSASWGGAATDVCDGPSQTLTVKCE